MGLPVVSYETRVSTAESIGDGYLVRKLKEMEKENVEIWAYLVNTAQTLEQSMGFDTAISSLMQGVVVYELLRRQDESDELNKEWK